MSYRFGRSILTWRVPPNWSPKDWSQELRAEVIAATWEAECDFDPARGVPLEAFVQQRSLGPSPESLSAGMGLCPALPIPLGGQ